MSSRQGGSAARSGGTIDRTRAPATAAPARAPASTPWRVSYDVRRRPHRLPTRRHLLRRREVHRRHPRSPAGSTHGAPRFPSVFGTRRR